MAGTFHTRASSIVPDLRQMSTLRRQGDGPIRCPTAFQRGERIAIKASLKILMPLLFLILPVILIVVAGPIIIKFVKGDLIPTGF